MPSSNSLDLSPLPEPVRTELLNFYQFLLQKYDITEPMPTPSSRLNPFSKLINNDQTELSQQQMKEKLRAIASKCAT